MIKLIACDLDGTLLLNGAQELRPETSDLILKLRKQGRLFVAASGRQYPNLRRLFEPVEDEIAYICENGALVKYQEKPFFATKSPGGWDSRFCGRSWRRRALRLFCPEQTPAISSQRTAPMQIT